MRVESENEFLPMLLGVRDERRMRVRVRLGPSPVTRALDAEACFARLRYDMSLAAENRDASA
jgi:hypothetical protein